MELISVNIGQVQSIQGAKTSGKTGIFKQPSRQPVAISTLGLAGDAICDTENHGGVDQAVYVYGTGDYAWWATQLNVELEPGTFGENLTIGALESATFHVGDRLHVGEVILEVTSPRIPCVTLAVRMGDPTFARRFRYAERPGLYCRVIRPGMVQAGDAVTVEPYAGDRLSVLEVARYFYAPDNQVETLRRHLAAPIAIRDRVEKEEMLQRLLDSASIPGSDLGLIGREGDLLPECCDG